MKDLGGVTTQEVILQALARIEDPDLGRDIVSLGFIKDLKLSGADVSFSIELTTPACPVRDQMKEQAHRAVLSLPGVRNVDVKMTSRVRATRSDEKDRLLPLVKNIVPVASGKGGVGKSTVSANVAVALSKLGARVGLMDADVYGPTIPTLMGADAPLTQQDGKIVPAICYGVKIISMDFLVPKGEAVIWRGPMLAKMVDQFLGGVHWGELDYLIVDLPPGTGDVQLSLCQKIPLTGAAIVSTPQDVAFKVAEKAIFMFNKLRTPVLGLVENMSGFECRHCGRREDIFGSGGARRYGMANNIPFLGAIPLATEIRATSDAGRPIVESASDSPSARAFMRVAENLAAQVSTRNIASMAGDRPEPAEITQPSRTEVRIVWKDGHESLYAGRALRAACRCAECVDELSGRKRLREAFLPEDIYPLAIEPVGRYAMQFRWSDGHSTGIYTFEHLRELCPCPRCAGEERTGREPATAPRRVAERLPAEKGRIRPMNEPITLGRDCEAVQIPSGDRVTIPAGTPVRITQSLGGAYTVITEQGYMARIAGQDADALEKEPVAALRAAEPTSSKGPADVESLVWAQLKTCYDPEIPVNIVDLGLIYSCVTTRLPDGGNEVHVRMTLTAPGCGMGEVLKADVERKVLGVPGVGKAFVEVVFDPAWGPGRMSEAAKLQLNML